MNKDKVYVFLDHGHCKSTPGKCSPDKTLLEYKYTREIVKKIEEELDKIGIKHWNDHSEDDFVYKTLSNYSSLDSRDLALRVSRINSKYEEIKKQGYKAFLISVHVNAAGNGAWLNASGWSCYTTKGQNNSDKLADCLYDAAEEYLKPLNKIIRTDLSDKDRDKESNLYILKNSNCPCTLTENFFQDNKNDVKWLLSEEGKNILVKIHIKGILNFINKL